MKSVSGWLERIKGFFVLEEEEEIEEEFLPREGVAGADAGQQVPYRDHAPSLVQKKKGKLVTLPGMKGFEVIFMEPSSQAEAQVIADALKRRSAMIVNLQHLDRESAMRIVDFISGITYALNGCVEKITDGIYFFAPQNVIIVPASKKGTPQKSQQLFLQ